MTSAGRRNGPARFYFAERWIGAGRRIVIEDLLFAIEHGRRSRRIGV